MDEARTPKGVTTGEGATKSQPLRNSCEPCHVSKLKCSREKPVCARCAKNGMNCTYAPVKRPGRPRKAPPTAGVTQSSAGILNLVAPSSSSQDVNAAESIDASVTAIMDSVGPNSCADVFDFVHTHMLDDDDDLFMDPLAKRPRHDYEDPWMLLGLPQNPPTVAPASSHSAMVDPSPRLNPSLWPSDPARFADDCASLGHWAAASPLLAPLRDADDDCICHAAAANLLFHRESVKSVQPSSAIEACLHLQRILDWTWATLKHCHGCWDDELIQFIVAGSAKEVVTIQRSIIDDMTRRLRNGGNAHIKSTNADSGQRSGNGRPYVPGSGCIRRQHSEPTRATQVPTAIQAQNPSVFQSTVLSFGDKVIQGSVKTVFLRRLISLRLRRLGSLLRELLSWTQTEASEASAASSLQVLISNILERINITTGMLSTLELTTV